MAGRRDEALAILGELVETAKTQHVPAGEIARIHIALGDKEQAFAWLGRAYAERDDWIPFLKVALPQIATPCPPAHPAFA